MNPLEDLLGMGYSGYAILDDVPMFLRPSSVVENDNHQKSEASFSTNHMITHGNLVARDRKSLTIDLETHYCPAIAGLVKKHSYGEWREHLNIDMTGPLQATIVFCNGEGYQCSLYIQKIEISCANNSLVTVKFSCTSWFWQDLLSNQVQPREGFELLPFSEEYNPVPFWKTTIETSVYNTNAVVFSWNLSFDNHWEFDQLLQGTIFAPNPQMVYVGQLETTLTLSWIALRSTRILDSGSFSLKIGTEPVITQIEFPLMHCEGTRKPNPLGSPNEVGKWEATFKTLGHSPY